MWGQPGYGGDTANVPFVFDDIIHIECGSACFAIKADTSAFAWGDHMRGGDAAAVDLTRDVIEISCGDYACAARTMIYPGR